MYKNIDEEMKAGKRASANIAIACFILLILALIIGYFAGYIDTVEKFNTFYKVENFHAENDTLWYAEYEIDSVRVFVLDLKHNIKEIK